MVNPQPSSAEDQLVAAMETLLDGDDQWRVVPSPGCVTMTRGWPDGSVDTLMLLSPDSAYAVREDPQGEQPWSMRGTLQQIVGHARRLVAPVHPDAPKARGSDMPGAERQ